MHRLSLGAPSGGYSLVTVCQLLLVVAYLVKHGLQACGLSSCGARASLLLGIWNLPRTHVPCISRCILNLWTTRGVLSTLLSSLLSVNNLEYGTRSQAESAFPWGL